MTTEEVDDLIAALDADVWRLTQEIDTQYWLFSRSLATHGPPPPSRLLTVRRYDLRVERRRLRLMKRTIQ